MKSLGIAVSKRKVILALVLHKSLIKIDENKGYKDYQLVRLQSLYVPKNSIEDPMKLFYAFDKLDIIKEADFCRVLYHRNKHASAETVAMKEVLYLLLKDQLKKMKKKYYVESARVLQYRLGKRKFMSHDKVLGWVLENVEGVTRQQLMGKRGVLIQTVLAVATACSEKASKHNWRV